MLGDREVFLSDLVQFLLVHFLKIEHYVSGSARRTNDLIQFYLQRFRVSVLCILNKKNHQEGYDRRPRVNHELPRITEPEQRTGDRPYEYYRDRKYEGDRPARRRGGSTRKPCEERNVGVIIFGLVVHIRNSCAASDLDRCIDMVL